MNRRGFLAGLVAALSWLAFWRKKPTMNVRINGFESNGDLLGYLEAVQDPITEAEFDEFMSVAFQYGQNQKQVLFFCDHHGVVEPGRDCPIEKAWLEAVGHFASKA